MADLPPLPPGFVAAPAITAPPPLPPGFQPLDVAPPPPVAVQPPAPVKDVAPPAPAAPPAPPPVAAAPASAAPPPPPDFVATLGPGEAPPTPQPPATKPGLGQQISDTAGLEAGIVPGVETPDTHFGADTVTFGKNVGQGAVNAVGTVPQGFVTTLAGHPYRMLKIFNDIDAGVPIDNHTRQGLLWVSEYENQPNLRPQLRKMFEDQIAQTPDPRTVPLYQFGQRIVDWGEKTFPLTPEQKSTFSGQVGQALGQLLVYSAGGYAAAAARLPAAGGLAITTGGAFSQAQQQFEDALGKGASIEQASLAAGPGFMVGLTEFLPVARMLDRLDKYSGGRLKGAIINAVRTGTEEGLQETFQQVLQNAIASKVVKYDPDRAMLEDAGEQGGIGATAGGIMAFITHMLGGRHLPHAAPQQATAQPAVQPPAQPAAEAAQPQPAPPPVQEPPQAAPPPEPSQTPPAPPVGEPTPAAPTDGAGPAAAGPVANPPVGQPPTSPSGEPTGGPIQQPAAPQQAPQPVTEPVTPPPAAGNRPAPGQPANAQEERVINDPRPAAEIEQDDRTSIIGMIQALNDALQQTPAGQVAIAGIGSVYAPVIADMPTPKLHELLRMLEMTAQQINAQSVLDPNLDYTPGSDRYKALDGGAQIFVGQLNRMAAERGYAINDPVLVALVQGQTGKPDIAHLDQAERQRVLAAVKILLPNRANLQEPIPPSAAPQNAAPRPPIGGQMEDTAPPAPAPQPVAPAPAAPPIDERPTPTAPELAGNVYQFDPDKLVLDPKTFQFKTVVNEDTGETGKLANIERWDPTKGGLAIVWEGPDGQYYVADGHQRVNLAKRLKAQGQDPKINAIVLRSSEGYDASMVRAIAAAANIAQNYDNAIDIARVFREGYSEYLQDIPRSTALANGKALARLGDDAFLLVVNEVVPDNYAAEVGRLIDDPQQQVAAIDALVKLQPENQEQARLIVQQVRDAGFQTQTQTGLFGEEQIQTSLFGERAKILDAAKKLLRRDRTLFKTLVEKQDKIAAAGNQLDTEANTGRLNDVERLFQLIDRLALRRGPVSDALTEAARRLKEGGTIGRSIRDFLNAVAASSEEGLGDRQNDSGNVGDVGETGDRGNAPQVGPSPQAAQPVAAAPEPSTLLARRRKPGFEVTPENPNQAVIPGAGRISTREAIEREMNKPMAPQSQQKPADSGLFDVEGRKQQDLFDQSTKASEEPDTLAAAMPSKGKVQSDRFIGRGLPNAPKRGPMSVPTPPGGAAGVATKLSNVLRRVREIVDVPVRIGRMGQSGSKAAGIYKTRPGVVRLHIANEIDVFSHEVGHALHFKYKSALDPIIRRHAIEIHPLMPPGYPPNLAPIEGFAEFFRIWMTNPAAAQRLAPKFTKDFETWLKRDIPGVAPVLQIARDEYQRYLAQPSGQAVESNITFASTAPIPAADRAIKRFKEDMQAGGRGYAAKEAVDDAVSFLNDKAGMVYTASVDKLHPIAAARDELVSVAHQISGNALSVKAANDPYKLARVARGMTEKSSLEIKDGIVPYGQVLPAKDAPSLRKAINVAAGGKWTFGARKVMREFSSYLVSRRAIKLWDRYHQGLLPMRPTQSTQADHYRNVKELEAKHPTFRDAADIVYAFMADNLQKKLDAGLIDLETFRKIKQESDDYVPFFRDMSDTPKVFKGLGFGPAAVVRRIHGSQRDIIDPLESIMRDVYQTNEIIANNDVVKALAELAQAAGRGGGHVAELIPTTQVEVANHQIKDVVKRLEQSVGNAGLTMADQVTMAAALKIVSHLPLQGGMTFGKSVPAKMGNEPIVTYLQDGKQIYVRLGRDDNGAGVALFNALHGLNEDELTGVWRMIANLSQVTRAGITTFSGAFAFANPIRDQFDAWAKTNVGYKPFLDFPRGAFDYVANTDVAKMFHIGGGGQSSRTLGTMQSDQLALHIADLKSKNIDVLRVVNPREALKLLAKFSDLTENGTRVGVFRDAFAKAKRRGLTDYEAMVEAAYEARDYIDFNRSGSKMQVTKRILVFLNAWAQGIDKGARLTGAGTRAAYIKLIKRQQLAQHEVDALAAGGGFWIKRALLGMMGLMLSYLFADRPEYDEAHENLGASHWIIPLPDNPAWGKHKILAWPKPFEVAVDSALTEYAWQAWAKKDPKAANRLMDTLIQMYQPPVLFPIANTAIEEYANRTMYTGQPIVPDHDKNLEPSMQWGPYTSELAKRLGAAIGVAPYRIDHVINGLGGTAGRDFTGLFDKVQPNAPEKAWDDIFVLRRFVRDPTRQSDAKKQFWSTVTQDGGKGTVAAYTFQALQRKADAPTATADEQIAPYRYVDSLEPWLQDFALLSKTDRTGKQRVDVDHPLGRAGYASWAIEQERKRLRTSMDYTPEEKQKLDDALTWRQTAEFRNALIAMGVPGYAHKNEIDLAGNAADIERISPRFAKELREAVEQRVDFDPAKIVAAYPALLADFREQYAKERAKAYQALGLTPP